MSVLLLPQAQDHVRVEKALPGFMFALAFESLRNEGYHVRADLEELANKTSQAALEGTYSHHQQKLATIIAKDGYAVMKDAGTDQLTLLIGAMSRLFPKIQDEGFDVDKDALLVALGIAAEIDDGVTDWGKPNQLTPIMGRLHNNLRRLGYFSTLNGAMQSTARH